MPQNLLGQATSPYLLQHKDNPVHWQPWGEEALAQAKAQDKPILLSIGYAACHWCHVMAHESFENPQIASLMNELFINIKVDREERPDIDGIYMSALHSLGEQGGWPLTMFLTPEGAPFWGGTYFPPEPRYGRPGFPQLLTEVSRLYKEERDKLLKNRDAILKALNAQSDSIGGTLPPSVLDEVATRLLQAVDRENGGIGGPPKFPQPFLFELLWRFALKTSDEATTKAVQNMLDHMAQGGIYDHLGGGFARYAVDEYWLVPHFEKMLYDNAQLLSLYTLVFQKTKNPLYEARIRETITWLLREMQVAEGGFAASLDADSEGEEGKFYVWQEGEIDAALNDFPPEDIALFKRVYDVTSGGTWEHKNILNRLQSMTLLTEDEEKILTRARDQLLSVRGTRIRPGFDDKILADWNGMTIAALAEAGAVFDEPAWLRAGENAYAAVMKHMAHKGRLSHAYRLNKCTAEGLSSDYALMARAGLKLYEITSRQNYLDDVLSLTDELYQNFWDHKRKGYYLTRHDAADIITRQRTITDDATPSANAVMIEVHARLWFLTGKEEHRERADDIIYAFAGEVARNFIPLGTFLNGFDFVLNALQIVLIGNESDPHYESLAQEIFAHSLPTRVLICLKGGAKVPEHHPAFGKSMIANKATVYACRGTECSLPITDVTQLSEAFAQSVS